MRSHPRLRAPVLPLAAMALGCLLAGTAHAGIVLDSMQAYLAPNRSTGQFTVYNQNPATAYVRVDVIEMTLEGAELDQGASDPEKALLASPNRLIVPAGGRQTVRLITLGNRDRERYFRVRFVPVAPRKADGFATSDDEERQATESMRAQLSIQIGYGARVVVAPHAPVFDTRIVPVAGGHEIHNEGSSTVYLVEHRSCLRASRDCKDLPGDRVDPLASLRLADDPGRYRSFKLKEGTSTSLRTIGDTD